MDQNQQTVPQRRSSAPFAWTAAAVFAALTLALVLTQRNSEAGPTKLQLPATVNAQNCMAVAKSAGLLKQKMSGARVGSYYAAWVNKLGGDKPTRSTLFNAGIAVAVCLR